MSSAGSQLTFDFKDRNEHEITDETPLRPQGIHEKSKSSTGFEINSNIGLANPTDLENESTLSNQKDTYHRLMNCFVVTMRQT